MKVAKETLEALKKEGIQEAEDLAEFTKETWKQVADNLKCPGSQMKNPDKEADKNHVTVPQTPYLFGAKTQKRLLEASKLMRYYETVGCCVTVSNTVYKTVIKSFTNQWTRLKDWTQQTQPVVPKITVELPVMQWTDVFDNFFHRKIGVRTISLSYMIRATVLASRSMSDHKNNLPHGEEFDSIEEELVAQASHTHPLYCEDNKAVYYCLEEAVQGTQYALSLKSYQQVKNGRGALVSITQQFAGTNKWQAELSMRDKFLHEKLPNEFTRVGFLIAGITSSDTGLQAVMTNIKSNADPASETSNRHHFELSANYLQPLRPVLKKFPSGIKRDDIKISAVSGSWFGTKPSAGKTGVGPRYHTSEEYKALIQPQKDEL
eukprot:2145755-Ditylum_brightwellii.AAC.1